MHSSISSPEIKGGTMYRILSKRNFLNVSDLAKLASAVSAFFGLEVIVEDADFDPSTTSADLRVITPNGKTVAYMVLVFILAINIGHLTQRLLQLGKAWQN